MKLSVMERLILLASLPKEQNYIHLKLLRKLKESLSIDNDEAKKIDFSINGEEFRWNPNAEFEKEVEIGDVEENIIKKELKQLDRAEKLTENHMSLYEKFIKEE